MLLAQPIMSKGCLAALLSCACRALMHVMYCISISSQSRSLYICLCHAQNQLFALQSDREAADAGRMQEAELAAAEVDAAQRRLSSLEAEKAALLAQVCTYWIDRDRTRL